MTAFCALCLDLIIGNPKKQPLGRNDALVNVCNTCDSAHPRSGLYSFSEGGAVGGSDLNHSGLRRLNSSGRRRGKS